MTKISPHSITKLGRVCFLCLLMTMTAFEGLTFAQDQGYASVGRGCSQSQGEQYQAISQDPQMQEWLDVLVQPSNQPEEHTDSPLEAGLVNEEDGLVEPKCGKGEKMDKGWCEPKCGKGEKMDKWACEAESEEDGGLFKEIAPEVVAGVKNQEVSEDKNLLTATGEGKNLRNRKNLPNDPVFRKLVDSVVLSQGTWELVGRKTSIEPVMIPATDDAVGLEGVEAPFPSIFNLWGDVVFEVRQEPQG